MVTKTKRCRARVHPGLPRGRIVLQSPGEGKGDKGTAGNSWKQLEPRGGFRQLPPCSILPAPGASAGREAPRDTGTRGHGDTGQAAGCGDSGAGTWPRECFEVLWNPGGVLGGKSHLPFSQQSAGPRGLARRLRAGFVAGMDGIGLSPAVPRWGHPEATATGQQDKASCATAVPGDFGRAKTPSPPASPGCWHRVWPRVTVPGRATGRSGAG